MRRSPAVQAGLRRERARELQDNPMGTRRITARLNDGAVEAERVDHKRVVR